MNVNQLQSPPQPHLQRFSKEGTDKDADFLALRLLNKRSRLRLSPESVDLDALPAKGRLFAVNNTRGWFAAATRNADGSHALALSPLAELRSALASSSSTDTTFSSRVTVPLPGAPHIVAFTHDGQRILVAFTNGPLNVYDSQSVFQGSGSAPLHTFPSASGMAIRDLFPCTGDAEQVAVLREAGDGLPVEIFDVSNMTSVGGWSSGGPGTSPTSLSWSPRGKQIAIGMENGDVVTYSPTDTSAVKSLVPHPPAVDGQSIISIAWLSNTEFHAIYAPVGPLTPDVDQTHFILSLEAKANAVGDVKLATPYLPFPGIRPPGSFTVALRNWDPSRLLLFVGDGTSSDVGLIGSLSESASSLDSWYNLNLEETSTPSVPLDADMNETVMLGLELDLTDIQPFKFTGASGEEQDVPPPPIMYLYASDGTLTGWHIIQTQGVAYPGMVSASASSASTPTSAPVQTTPQQSAFGASPAAASPFASTSPPVANSPFASTSPQNSSGTSTGSFGFSAFSGATPAFGSSSFGFGQQQPQQQQQATTSAPSAPAMSTPTISVDMTSSTDDNMAAETDTDAGFGGLSLGGGGDASKSSTGSNSMFGSFGANTQQPSTSPFGGATSSSTFGTFGAGPVKPATGFGAFANTGPSAFGSSGAFGGGASGGGAFSGGTGAFGSGASAFGSKPSDTSSSENKPPSGFGQTGSGSATAAPAFGKSTFGVAALSSSAFSGLGQSSSAFGKPSFGQSSFGQPSLGQPAFGQSAFGQTSTPASAAPQPASTSAFGSGGGFASFANAGTSAFSAIAQQNKDAKPVWSSAGSTDKSGDSTQPKSAFGGSDSTAPATTPALSASSTPASAQEKPTPAVSTPPATPPSKPAVTPAQTPTPAETATTPTATPAPSGGAFGSFTTTPAASLPSTGGAFGGLTTSTTGFSKLQSGFGAFGSTTPSSSPFFQKPGSTTPPATSVFGQTSFGSGTTTPTSKPDATGKPAFGAPSFGAPSFGAPSAFGTAPSTSFFGKSNLATSSPFGKPAEDTTPKTPTTSAPVTSAFSAFTGSSSPFGSAAASSAGKSFGEMLRGGDKGKEKEKEGDEAKKDEAKPTGFSRTAEEWKKPVSVFASLKLAEKTPEKGKDDDEDAEAEEEEEEDDEGADTSFRSHEDEDEVDDGIDAFLKSDDEDFGSDEDDVPPEVEEEEEEEEDATTSSQRTPDSPTVKQATPPKAPASIFSSISFTPPTPPKDKGTEREDEPSKPVFIRERSTTPPGSPSDSEAPPSAVKPTDVPPRASSAPPASAAASASSGFLGVRPSTRPVRSSPLAKPAYSGDEDEDEDEDREKTPLPLKKARSESPSVPTIGTAVSRPKTPPMLFGTTVAPPKPAPFSLAPSAPPSFAPSKSPTLSPAGGKPAETAKLPTPSPSPSPSLAGPGAPGSTSIFGATSPVFTPPATTGGGFFGQKPLGTPESQTSFFGQKPLGGGTAFGMSKSPALSAPGGGIFSATPAATQLKPSSPAPPATPAFAGFGAPATAAQPSKPSPLSPNAAVATPGPSAFPSLSRPPSVAPAMPPASPVQDMQSEVALLFTSLNKELEDLKALAAHASMRTAQLGKPGTGLKTSHDLKEPTNWVLSDLTAFKQIMKEVERELEKWQSEKEKCISYLRELESDMLKGSTRKEEIERFSKASKDTDFARMLKARMLNPDHLETQSQLRREIRTIRGRLQQLEDYIQSSKKKLNSVKSGKPTLKPPSLDTINRTYRNIDLAIEQEEEDVSNLAERLSTLEVSSKSPLLSFTTATRDRRLPDRNQRVGREVTPNIAASTAAALNAERSAQKLKRALLNARKQPLLNTKAVDATPPEREQRIPRKPLLAPGSGVGIGAAFAAGLQGGFPSLADLTPIKGEPGSPVLQWTPPPPGSIPPPSWSLPPFELDGGSPLAGLGGSRGGRGSREKAHAKPIQMHRDDAKLPPPPPPAGFSWGPVPVIQPKSTISIFAGFGKGKGKARAKDEEDLSDSLGGSWVADDFGTSTPQK
ncbi:hypothetical protein K466DRAFT_666322 [Polyporus arcularius HHB13444]|uniref:Nucleoporin Nup159/Nup146 N-terminal domain-containing protein n=1 Tax=Polyporus arcularius HHB13444 TaxID=1314778 RepID=A0A5C3P317_9APHY|nr:hypothetical protein K466DRAFT_666322 [Polyporus arcularius HHB13444]